MAGGRGRAAWQQQKRSVVVSQRACVSVTKCEAVTHLPSLPQAGPPLSPPPHNHPHGCRPLTLVPAPRWHPWPTTERLTLARSPSTQSAPTMVAAATLARAPSATLPATRLS